MVNEADSKKDGMVDYEGEFKLQENVNWHERAAFQRSAFGRSTAGNDVVATIFIRLFRPDLFS